jgi:DNA polymerase-3 subunit gamma/tau
MSYTALYRKWRPATFEDVRGQEPIVTALKNQVKTGRIGHAYLFCGTRGTGKTSVAKILARAVNCEHPKDGNPCNECELCKAANQGASINVVEIDAASNNGVDNIREIRDEVRYTPAQGKYRVYIIDEVHMLSTGAFNALLKTLEEPPAHVIFILATTEVHKIPITVLSRCQRYDFRRISSEVITGRLQELTQGEQISIEDRALRYIARKADGSLRDAISLLDQCIAFHFNERLTYDSVLEVLGAASYDLFGKLLLAAIEGRSADCIYQIDEIVMQGRELSQLVSDFIWYLRNLMLLKSSDLDADTLEVSEEELLELGKMAARMQMPELLRYLRVFSELAGKMRNAVDKRVQLEMAFIRLTKPEMEVEIDSVLERLAQLEHKLETMKVRPVEVTSLQEPNEFDYYAQMAEAEYEYTPVQEEVPEVSIPKQVPPPPQNAGPVVLPPKQFKQYEDLSKNWSKFIEKLSGRAEKVALRGTYLETTGENAYTVVFEEEGKYAIGARETTKQHLETLALELFKTPMIFKFKLSTDLSGVRTQYVSGEELHQVFQGIEIEEEEE